MDQLRLKYEDWNSFNYGTVYAITKMEEIMRYLLILFVLVSSLSLLTGCGGGAEGMAGADGLAGEGLDGIEGEGLDGIEGADMPGGLNALGMDDAPAGLVDDATAFMKTTPDNGGGIFPPTDVVSDVPNGILPPMGENTDGVLLAQAVIPPASSLSPQDRWTGAAIARTEAGNNPQGQTDVIQATNNRRMAPAYNCNSIADCVNKPGQYEPTFSNPSAWRNINSPESAARAAGVPVSEIIKADQNINNPKLQQNAADHVGCFTDFQGMSEKPYKKPGDVDRGDGHNFFGNFYPSSGYKCK